VSQPVRETPYSSIAAAASHLTEVIVEADREITAATEALTRGMLKRAKAQAGLAALGIQTEVEK
jgi:hypothetical protein